MELRSYQNDAINLTTEKFRHGKKRLINWLPTGSGKGVIMSEFCRRIISNKKKILTVMRRRDLIFQTQKNYSKYHNIYSSVIIGNTKGYDRNNHVQIASIDTLRNRIDKLEYQYLKGFDVIIIDECHDTTSPTYQKLFEFLGDKIYIGFTATPFSISGKPLLFWQDYVQPISAAQLVDSGHLVDFEIYSPFEIDTSKVKTQAGDFNQKQLAEVSSELKVIANIVDSWIKYGENRKTICFAVNKDHSKLLAREFNSRGVPAIHADESTPKEEREIAIEGLKSGKYRVLCNVNIFSTGVDIPEASCGILARPTKSEVLFIQQIGRLSRPCLYENKKDAIILDHGGNCVRHGHPYEERIPCLTEIDFIKKKKKETEEIIESLYTCKGCYYVFKSHETTCPNCGAEKPKQIVKIHEGELRKIKLKKLTIAEKLANKLEKLKELGKKRYYQDNWAFYELHKRNGDIIFEHSKALKLPSWLMKMTHNVTFEQFKEANE